MANFETRFLKCDDNSVEKDSQYSCFYDNECLGENNHELDIYTASLVGDYAMISYFLKSNNVGLTQRNKNGWTSMMYACYGDHEDIATLLVQSGVYKNYSLRDRWTSFTFAAVNGNQKLLSILYENSFITMKDENGWTTLFYAVSRRKEESVKFLLKQGANVNDLSQDSGETVLMVAVASGKESIVRMLLAAGAEPMAVSWKGETALTIAINHGWFRIIQLFLPSARTCELPYANLHSLLSFLNLKEYWPCFENHNIDLEAFLHMNEMDLRDLGIWKIGPRKKIIAAILQWHSQHQAAHISICETCRITYT